MVDDANEILPEATAADLEGALASALLAAGIEVRPDLGVIGTAIGTIMEGDLDDGHIEDILHEMDAGDVEDADAQLEIVGVYVRDTVRRVIASDIYTADKITLYRAIKVTCPPEDVVSSGPAEAIGVHWSTASEMDDPDFLEQYGAEDGRVVTLVAEVSRWDVCWMETFAKRCNPWIRDYEEVVLRPDAMPRIISVDDPKVDQAPTP